MRISAVCFPDVGATSSEWLLATPFQLPFSEVSPEASSPLGQDLITLPPPRLWIFCAIYLVRRKLTGTGQVQHCSTASCWPPPAILGSPGQPYTSRILHVGSSFQPPCLHGFLNSSSPKNTLCFTWIPDCAASCEACNSVAQWVSCWGWDFSLLSQLPQDLKIMLFKSFLQPLGWEKPRPFYSFTEPPFHNSSFTQAGWWHVLQLLTRMCRYISLVLSFSPDSKTMGDVSLNTNYS